MTQDLMIQPEDSLLPVAPKEPVIAELKESLDQTDHEVSFTVPATWGSDMTLKPAEITSPQETPQKNTEPLQPVVYPWLPNQQNQVPPSQPTPLPHPEQPQTPQQTISPQASSNQSSFNLPRIILIGLVLVLCGVLLGILASKYFPFFVSKPIVELGHEQPVVVPTTISPINPSAILISPKIEIAPTATSSTLVNLRWNLVTIKSPVSFFSSYRLHYPITWAVKESRTTKGANDSGSSVLTMTKGKTSFKIIQSVGDAAGCLYPGDADKDGMYQRYQSSREIIKPNFLWRWGQVVGEEGKSLYYVCELKSSGTFVASTVIGYISLSDSAIDDQTLEEFNYILEKIEIINNTSPISVYQCPTSGWVDCQPVLDDAKTKACSTEAMAWYKTNCPNFQGEAL